MSASDTNIINIKAAFQGNKHAVISTTIARIVLMYFVWNESIVVGEKQPCMWWSILLPDPVKMAPPPHGMLFSNCGDCNELITTKGIPHYYNNYMQAEMLLKSWLWYIYCVFHPVAFISWRRQQLVVEKGPIGGKMDSILLLLFAHLYKYIIYGGYCGGKWYEYLILLLISSDMEAAANWRSFWRHVVLWTTQQSTKNTFSGQRKAPYYSYTSIIEVGGIH